MRPARVARLMGVNQKTVLNWTDHPFLRRFYSPEASAEDGQTRRRDYNERDVLVLNTIRLERAKNVAWEKIAELLASGYLDSNLPASSLLVETTMPAVQYERFVALVNERDAALREAERLQTESDHKETLLNGMREEIQALSREVGEVERLRIEDKLKDQMLEELQREIQHLNRQVGEVERLRTEDQIKDQLLDELRRENKQLNREIGRLEGQLSIRNDDVDT